jgi:hypothetical protein
MATKDAADVAKRCLCLELLLQRLGLELDEDDEVAELDAVRVAWLSRVGELGLEGVLVGGERGFLERPVGDLTEDETDEIEGHVIASLIFLWSLSRLGGRPTAAILGKATDVVAEYGLLGDGSIPGAIAAVSKVELRPESELRDALDAYARTQKAATDPAEPEGMVAGIAVHALTWILDRDVTWAALPRASA